MNLYTMELFTQDHQQNMMREADNSRLAKTASKRPSRVWNLLRVRPINKQNLISDKPRIVRGQSVPARNEG
jgi:predicted TIM-barrel fold metal-dependent hydrolase